MIATLESTQRRIQVDVVDVNSLQQDSPDARWLAVFRDALGHQPYLLRAESQGQTCGALPLALVKSVLFGRFLVSLPYLNSAGVQAADPAVGTALVDRAVQLADELNVRYLELRQEQETSHSALAHASTAKSLMRLALPKTTDELWTSFKSKLRSQLKAGMKHDFQTEWGGAKLLDEFYHVFSRNMRDLGTPVYPARLFAEILLRFPAEAEICVLRLQGQPLAAALLLHHAHGVSEVPSASSLRTHNNTNVNMVMYWQLLSRAIERGQTTFDFGRSTVGGGTYRFKEQWGASPHPSVWQYYLRRGSTADMRPDNSRFSLAVKVWQRLPVAVTRLLGPSIVRGIP